MELERKENLRLVATYFLSVKMNDLHSVITITLREKVIIHVLMMNKCVCLSVTVT